MLNNNIQRFFSFGCSFTNYFYPTWADFIGINYTNYYNLGCPGLSNATMRDRFTEVDNLFKFNSNDLVIVALSGLGRYNFLVEMPDKKTGLWAGGDLEKDAMDGWILNNEKLKHYYDIIKFMRDKFWKRKWGIYHTWLTVKTIKRICQDNKVNHKIILSLDMNFYRDIELLDLEQKEIDMVEEIYSILDVKVSLQEYAEQNFINKFKDSHPFIDSHFSFIKTYLPEFVSDKSHELFLKATLEANKYNNADEVYKNLSKFKTNIPVDLYGEYT
jgi:hypothetical protein